MQVGDNGQAAYEEFEQRKREEEREVIEQIMSSMEAELDAEDEEEGAVRLQVGYDIKEPPVPLQEIKTKRRKLRFRGPSSDWIVRSFVTEVRYSHSI